MGIKDPSPHLKSPVSYLLLSLLLLTGFLFVNLFVLAQETQKAEVTSQEAQPTFKLQVQRNLVLVRVVVRDDKGNAVGNLRQQDFRLFDNGKPQTITQFAVEKAASSKPAPTPKPQPTEVATEANPDTTNVPFTPLRYLGLYFDDVHADYDGLVRTRDAAEHFLERTIQPGDHIAVATASGQVTLDFTDDRSKIHDALFRLQPRPVVRNEVDSCPDMFAYQAYLIVDRREQHALEEATEEIVLCRYRGDRRYYGQAQFEAEGDAVRILNQDLNQSQYTFRGLELMVRRLAALPGQRSIVMVSPGFFTETEKQRISEIVDQALRSRVVVNALDSKGLFAYIPLGDATKRAMVVPQRPDLMGKKAQDQIDSYQFDGDVMAQLAGDTGGVFFHNSNDLDEGFRRVSSLPDVYYVLGFSPDRLKFDGRFHTLRVSLAEPEHLSVQARRGYFAPKHPKNAEEQQKQDLEEAIFSQDELNGLPVEVHTQFFKVGARQSKLSVIAHMDLRLLHFRKESGRNLNNLTFVTALFDRDGNCVESEGKCAITEKTVEFHLRDITLEKLSQSGIMTKTSFDVQPGTYLVREVVRESEGGQISELNRTVEIPF